MSTVREQVMDFASNPLAKNLLIEGPIGSGKSTLARACSMAKRMAPLTVAAAGELNGLTRFDESGGVDLKLMPWYVELALTGLADNLVDAQLFGSVKGAYTDAPDRPGIFELAMTGRRTKKDKTEPGADLTNGVVFLDEIGDLSNAHQAKLLPVLSSGVFYRLGAEGAGDRELQYAGTTIAASWRHLHGVLRPDLYSRFSAGTIRLPGLADRMEDFEVILDKLQDIVVRHARREIDRMIRAEQHDLDRNYWNSRHAEIAPLDKRSRRLLSNVDWSSRGNMRGLAAAVEKIIINDKLPEEAISSAAEMVAPDERKLDASTLFERLLRRKSMGLGLAGLLREIEVEQRRELQDLLLTDSSAKKRLAAALNLDLNAVSSQIHQLDRRRTSRRDGGKAE